jgi:hypothetical protein
MFKTRPSWHGRIEAHHSDLTYSFVSLTISAVNQAHNHRYQLASRVGTCMPSTKLRSTTSTPATKSANVGTPLPFAPRTPARPFVDAQTAAPVSKGATPADVNALYKAPATQSSSNVLGDPTQNLQTFLLQNLALFTKEGTFPRAPARVCTCFMSARKVQRPESSAVLRPTILQHQLIE